MVAERRLRATEYAKGMKLSLLLLLLLLTIATSVLFENQTCNRVPEVSGVGDLTSDDVPRLAKETGSGETWAPFTVDPVVRVFTWQ